MNYIVFDLEATCWSESHELLEQEIIEIGAFMVNRYGELTASFGRFIRPVIHPYLSPFCQSLTNITQEQVEEASTFDRVFDEFNQWVDDHCEEEGPRVYASWGHLDVDLIRHDCDYHSMDFFWEENHFDVKKAYNKMKGKKKYMGFQTALKKEQMEFEGSAHRAYDDAYNLALLFRKYIDQWDV